MTKDLFIGMAIEKNELIMMIILFLGLMYLTFKEIYREENIIKKYS